MKNKIQTIILLIAILVTWLTSCLAQPALETNTHYKEISSTGTPQPSKMDECIPVSANLALPIGVYGISEPNQIFTPPLGWELITSLPSAIRSSSLSLELIENTIWVSDRRAVAKFDVSKGVWDAYATFESDRSNTLRLWLAHNGDLWKIYSDPFRLELFNSGNDRFESIAIKQDNVELNMKVLKSNVVEDKNGKLWFFLQNAANPIADIYLFSFDPQQSQITEEPIKLKYSTFINMTANVEGVFWIVTVDSIDDEKRVLIKYDPNTDETHYLSSLPRKGEDIPVSLKSILDKVPTPFQDYSGKLWLGNKGWLDFSDPDYPKLYQIILPPEFLTYRYEEPPTMVLTTYIEQILQSSNDWMWFASDAGVVRLKISSDYQHGDWCLVTNGANAILRESNGYLWMLVNKQIYRYQVPNP